MTEKNDIQEIVHSIASELIQVVNKEHSMLLSEIARMKNIISEASINLHQSFNGMNSDNSELLRVLATIKESNDEEHVIKDDYNKLMSGQNVSMGIRALQFEDIIQQMLDHARHRIHSIDKLFSILEQKVINFDDAIDIKKIKETLLDCREEIQKTRKLLELENPVKLDSLGKNDVTLF
ncbi:MAG TPA: hypothetical protein VJ981_02050 [Gammaproteobacteria bacterium]|nr:hypothetical protein [Gammaproteobacteria bacterium]